MTFSDPRGRIESRTHAWYGCPAPSTRPPISCERVSTPLSHGADIELDLQFVDLALDHLGDRSAIERLARDVAGPAREAGCGAVWLGGISLGGSFVLDYAAIDAGPWDGMCLLAPYPGNRLLIGEIVRAGCLTAWQPGPLAESDEERRIWRFIQARGAGGPPLFLGYGREDRFAQGLDLMAQALPQAAVHVIEGGHDWSTWSRLWERFLDLRWI